MPRIRIHGVNVGGHESRGCLAVLVENRIDQFLLWVRRRTRFETLFRQAGRERRLWLHIVIVGERSASPRWEGQRARIRRSRGRLKGRPLGVHCLAVGVVVLLTELIPRSEERRVGTGWR